MEPVNYLRFVLALIFVLGLIGSLAMLARRYGLGLRAPTRRVGRRRLSIAEIMPLDAKRRAVLIRRDDVEHLVILGPHGETVVEVGLPAAESFADTLDGTTKTDGDTSP